MQSEWKNGRIELRTVAWGTYWLTKYHLGYAGGLEEAYRQGVRSLTGLLENELDEQTRTWFYEEVAHRLRPGSRAALHAHREQGDRVVLATCTSVYEARCAAKEWGLELGVSHPSRSRRGDLPGTSQNGGMDIINGLRHKNGRNENRNP